MDVPATPPIDLIAAAVARTRQAQPALIQRLQTFQSAADPADALRAWFGPSIPRSKHEICRSLQHAVARIDQLLCDQINGILHHPAFQRLEAAWRGLDYLTRCAQFEGDSLVKIKVLSVTWRELENDFDRSSEFDQSQLFRKVYEDEFGTPGGEPFGVLIGDYDIHPVPRADHPHDDMSVLRRLSQVAAAAFCPIIVNASPAMFGMDDFSGLEYTLDHQRTLSQAIYHAWRSLRDTEDARFVGLALPRILLRVPYADDGSRVDRFLFREEVAGPDHGRYLWGGAAFAFGEVVIRSFAQAGWLADIRGVSRDELRGGLVTGLPVPSWETDSPHVALKTPTDVVITDLVERQLSDLGFLPLCPCKDTPYAAFYSNQSIQKPKKYDRPEATVNAQMSAMLQYMLCVSRFAHYIKVIGREKTGSFTEAGELEDYLQRWIVRYVTPDREASAHVKARHPLRDAQVRVYPTPGKPGSFQCTMHLAPHYELDELRASVRLVADLVPAK